MIKLLFLFRSFGCYRFCILSSNLNEVECLPVSDMPFATLNLYKPKGPTSHDMVAQMRKVFGLKKVGHLGTLDPMAEGVLPLCLGNATRLIEYFPDTKTYEAGMRLGVETTTLDLEGEPWKEKPCPPGLTREQIIKVFQGFKGEIQQRVPRYSAVHFKGKKLYHYARAGVRIPFEELPVKPVTIFELDLLEVNLELEQPEFKIRVDCSSGTYIRSLIRDIAYELGTVAVMTSLVRTRHGKFTVEKSHSVEAVKQAAFPLTLTVDPLSCIELPMVHLKDETDYQRLLHGAVISKDQFQPHLKHNDTVAMAMYNHHFAGIVEWNNDRLRPKKILDVDVAQKP